MNGESYVIRSEDPSGEFLATRWQTPQVPCKGELVHLPYRASDPDGSNERWEWQELTVDEICHFPDRVEIHLGGSDGWEEGGVKELFDAATAWLAQHNEDAP